MSLDVLTAIWRDPPCKGGDLLCLLAIADNADENGFAWPSVETIARKAAMSERGAQKCIRKLVEAGLISVDSGGGRNKTNAYQITTNGVGEGEKHKNPEQNTPNPGSPFTDENPEQCDINPEQRCTKPRTPVHPNSQEPSIEPSVEKSEVDEAFDVWNVFASRNGWAEVKERSAVRRRALNARLSKHSLSGWIAALERAERSDFLMGRVPPRRGSSSSFRLTFKFFSSETNFTEIMEGNYDNRDRNPAGRGAAQSGFSDGFAAVAQRYDNERRADGSGHV